MAAKRPSRSSPASSARPAARAARKAPAKSAAKSPAKARAKLPRKVAAGTKPATTKLPKAKAKAKARAKAPPALAQVVLAALEDMKAVNVKAMDVRDITDITDMMVVASGTSDRHVKSIADRVVQRCKEAGYRPYGIEGERDGEWVLLDLNDVVLHVMLPRVREFYALEKLWEKGAARGS
ncbi:MAG: ribosome silencing factor [Steroidobacteraceae bacterium]|nr:ribosome silencing factor [Steroidobacteraceae bacterium]